MMQNKPSKRYQKRSQLVDPLKRYSLEDAVKLIKQVESTQYDETVALDFQLGIKLESGTEMLVHVTR